MKYGHGCGIATDPKDRIFVTSRSESSRVAVFDPAEKILETWSNDFVEKVGMEKARSRRRRTGTSISKEGSDEFIYFTGHVAKDPPSASLKSKLRH